METSEMRIMFMLPVVLGLSVLAGCGGGRGEPVYNGTGSSATKSLRYTLTDLGALPVNSSSASKAVPQQSGGAANAAGQGVNTRSSLTRSSSSLKGRSVADLTGLGEAIISLHGAAINNAGQVVTTAGSVFNTQGAQAFVYQAGTKTTLGTLGGTASFGFDVNASGQAVGASSLAGDNGFHACLYDQHQVTDLGTLGGSSSAAYALNNAGQIVGISDTQPASSAPPTDATDPATPHIFLYEKGQMRDLGTLPGYDTTPYAINDSGQIAGRAVSLGSDNLTAITVNNGMITPLPSLGGNFDGAFGINNNGVIVGASATAPLNTPNYQQHAAMWQNGKITDLGTLPNGNHAIAFGVNSQGNIVGGSTAAAHSLYDHGFVRPHNGTMQDLNTLIPANSGWLLLGAQSINDQGQIVGTGRVNGEFHAYLLTPAGTATGL